MHLPQVGSHFRSFLCYHAQLSPSLMVLFTIEWQERGCGLEAVAASWLKLHWVCTQFNPALASSRFSFLAFYVTMGPLQVSWFSVSPTMRTHVPRSPCLPGPVIFPLLTGRAALDPAKNISSQQDLMSLFELMFIWKTCFLMWIKVLVSSVYISFKKSSWNLPVQDSVHATAVHCRPCAGAEGIM